MLYKHLLRDGVIGDEEEAEAKTLMDYVLKEIPEIKKVAKAQQDTITKDGFFAKNLQAKVMPVIQKSLPDHIKKVELANRQLDQKVQGISNKLQKNIDDVNADLIQLEENHDKKIEDTNTKFDEKEEVLRKEIEEYNTKNDEL